MWASWSPYHFELYSAKKLVSTDVLRFGVWDHCISLDIVSDIFISLLIWVNFKRLMNPEEWKSFVGLL